nr:MAG TPA: hypothetical protein [Caudoviricetes sp.]
MYISPSCHCLAKTCVLIYIMKELEKAPVLFLLLGLPELHTYVPS